MEWSFEIFAKFFFFKLLIPGNNAPIHLYLHRTIYNAVHFMWLKLNGQTSCHVSNISCEFYVLICFQYIYLPDLAENDDAHVENK